METLEVNEGYHQAYALIDAGQILPARRERVWAIITNVDDYPVYLMFPPTYGKTVTGIYLHGKGSSFTIDRVLFPWYDSVYAVRAGSSNGTLGYTEVYWRRT